MFWKNVLLLLFNAVNVIVNNSNIIKIGWELYNHGDEGSENTWGHIELL